MRRSRSQLSACGIHPRESNSFIENLLFHRARKFYFWMVSFQGKPASPPPHRFPLSLSRGLKMSHFR